MKFSQIIFKIQNYTCNPTYYITSTTSNQMKREFFRQRANSRYEQWKRDFSVNRPRNPRIGIDLSRISVSVSKRMARDIARGILLTVARIDVSAEHRDAAKVNALITHGAHLPLGDPIASPSIVNLLTRVAPSLFSTTSFAQTHLPPPPHYPYRSVSSLRSRLEKFSLGLWIFFVFQARSLAILPVTDLLFAPPYRHFLHALSFGNVPSRFNELFLCFVQPNRLQIIITGRALDAKIMQESCSPEECKGILGDELARNWGTYWVG